LYDVDVHQLRGRGVGAFFSYSLPEATESELMPLGHDERGGNVGYW
jgi:hypothetical protein